MASINDKLRKYKSLFSTTLSTGIGTGTSDTITPATVTGLPTDTAITLTIDRVDSSGIATPSKLERIKGIISGGNLIDYVRGVDGTTEQSHTAGAVVEMVWNAADLNDIVDWGLVEHSQLGVHDKTKVVDLTTAQTLTNKTLTSPILGGTPVIDATSAIPFYGDSMSRQAIINGNFDVWQRGTSVAMTAANAYAADRWYCETATAGTDKTVSREDGTGVNGSYYCARVKMVGDVDELLTFSQALESQDSIKFRGQKVTLSFYARGGAEFVADNATLVSKIATGKGADQKLLAFTTLADGVAQNNTLTTSWQKFTCTTTAVIAADITQIGVSFAFTHAGSGTTSNYFEVTQVQLCAGDVALPFMPKSYEEELRACQRYAWVLTTTGKQHAAIGVAATTTIAYLTLFLPVEMRTLPTMTKTVEDWQLNDMANAGVDVTVMDVSAPFSSTKIIEIEAQVAAGLTQYRQYKLSADNTSGRVMILSAEL